MSPRRFEYVEGNSCKFWECLISGSTVTVRYGRIGTAGQSQTKTLDSVAAANRHAAKLVNQKLGKGYREVQAA